MRRTVVHEYVIHCGLSSYLTKKQKEMFLERIAAGVPYSQLRTWFGDPSREAYYRLRHAVGADLLTPTGHLDPSSSNQFTTDGVRALAYVEEAFAALVDVNLGLRFPRRISPLDGFELRVHVVADLLLAVAQGKVEVPALVAAVESL